MIDNSLKKPDKNLSSELSSEKNHELLNLIFNPATAQVQNFLFKFRKCKLTKQLSNLETSGSIQVQKIIKNNFKIIKFRNERNLLSAWLRNANSSLWFVYPPYTMGVKIPP